MPKLILIPGLISDPQIWQFIVKPLADYSPIIANVSQMTSIEQIARKILAENTGKLFVVGHSMGGIIAVEMYRQAPERIEKLALLNSSMLPKMEGETAYRQGLVDQVNENGVEILIGNWLPRLVHPSRHDDLEFMSLINASIMSSTAKQHETQNNALLNRPDGYATIPNINCPTLVLAGQQDKLCRADENAKIANQIKNSTLVIIEQCAHFSPLEHPKQVSAALNKWLLNE